MLRSAFVLFFVLLFTGAAQAEGVGVYTGSFDPPTKAHFAIMKAALKEYGLSKLYVLVNRDGGKGKNYWTTPEERVALLKAGTVGWGDHLEFLPMLHTEKEQFVQEIKARTGSVTQFIGEDSFEGVPADALKDPHLSWVVFPRDGKAPVPSTRVSIFPMPETSEGLSSTAARQALVKGKQPTDILDDAVLQAISEMHLYRQPPRAK